MMISSPEQGRGAMTGRGGAEGDEDDVGCSGQAETVVGRPPRGCFVLTVGDVPERGVGLCHEVRLALRLTLSVVLWCWRQRFGGGPAVDARYTRAAKVRDAP